MSLTAISPETLHEFDALTDTLSPSEQKVVQHADTVVIDIRDISSAKAASNALGIVGREVTETLDDSPNAMSHLQALDSSLEGARNEMERQASHDRMIQVPRTMARVLIESMRLAGETVRSGRGSYYASIGRHLIEDMHNPKNGAGLRVDSRGIPIIVI